MVASLFAGRRKKIIILIFILVVLLVASGLTVYFLHNRHNKKAGQPAASQSLTNAQILNAESNGATDFVKSKDYTSAVSSYLSAAYMAAGMGNYTQAKDILQECIAKVPDNNVTFYVYDALANMAKNLNNKSLEKDSLQKALAKAQQPGSGAPSSLISYYEQQLKGLGQ